MNNKIDLETYISHYAVWNNCKDYFTMTCVNLLKLNVVSENGPHAFLVFNNTHVSIKVSIMPEKYDVDGKDTDIKIHLNLHCDGKDFFPNFVSGYDKKFILCSFMDFIKNPGIFLAEVLRVKNIIQALGDHNIIDNKIQDTPESFSFFTTQIDF